MRVNFFVNLLTIATTNLCGKYIYCPENKYHLECSFVVLNTTTMRIKNLC